jgi:pyruvate kinase
MMNEKALWFTNGPKTDKPEMAVKMIKSGATGVRLSMS